MENLRLNALALHLGVEVEDLGICSYNDQIVEYRSQEYLVVTDEEADELWDEDLENYIDECIISELPELYKNYFNVEAWKNDVLICDGRAHSLNKYDGEEVNITVYYTEDGEFCSSEDDIENEYNEILEQDFYIYRQN